MSQRSLGALTLHLAGLAIIVKQITPFGLQFAFSAPDFAVPFLIRLTIGVVLFLFGSKIANYLFTPKPWENTETGQVDPATAVLACAGLWIALAGVLVVPAAIGRMAGRFYSGFPSLSIVVGAVSLIFGLFLFIRARQMKAWIIAFRQRGVGAIALHVSGLLIVFRAITEHGLKLPLSESVYTVPFLLRLGMGLTLLLGGSWIAYFLFMSIQEEVAEKRGDFATTAITVVGLWFVGTGLVNAVESMRVVPYARSYSFPFFAFLACLVQVAIGSYCVFRARRIRRWMASPVRP